MGRKGMAQSVGGHRSANTHFSYVLFNNEPQTLASQALTTMVEEQSMFIFLVD